MNHRSIHRIRAADSASSQLISTLLAELQSIFIRAKTPVGAAVSSVISTWRQEKDGTFVIQFSPLAAARLPALSGLELLQAAKGLAAEAAPA
ncbi:MAG: hypothetical protein ACOY41_01955 [Pseudomonadota bacterium]